MTLKTGRRTELPGTISSLRLCNELQSEVIASMEQYQSVVENGGERDQDKSGRSFGYLAELSYLHNRRNALDSLIDAVERYHLASDGGEWSGRQK